MIFLQFRKLDYNLNAFFPFKKNQTVRGMYDKHILPGKKLLGIVKMKVRKYSLIV